MTQGMAITPKSISAALDGLPGFRAALNELGGSKLLDAFDVKRREEESKPRADFGPLGSTGLLSAALQHTYSLEDLLAFPREENYLVAHSSLVSIDGKRKLRLENAARAEILNAAKEAGTLKGAIEQGVVGIEPVSADTSRGNSLESRTTEWIRDILMGFGSSPAGNGVLEGRARIAALEALSEFGDGTRRREEIQNAESEWGMKDLLEPLLILIGIDPEREGADRFAGRKADLKKLRMFVDVLEAESNLEGFERQVGRFARAFKGRQRLLELVAGGGMGKSTLIAKFVIDHARNARAPFPFAYFDFDRSTLQPRDAANLLSETARQLALQFPEKRLALHGLRRESASGITSKIGETAYKLREIVESILREQHAPVFLLVLDTLEVVQSDPRDVAGICAFLDSLVSDEFPRLAVVASGRSEVPELRELQGKWSASRHELKTLSIPDARDMADRLGQSLLPELWGKKWGGQIAGRDQSSLVRREPLCIRIAVELVRSAPHEEREALLSRIETMEEDQYLGRLYGERILNHIRSTPARKLAWPGLIVRRINRQLVVDVLAPICNLSEQDIDPALEILGREVWIVEREGEQLRHRPDLRARTLPWMRRFDRSRFLTVCDAMVDYYGKDRNDDQNRASEYVYYRLLRGDDPTGITEMHGHALDHFLASVRDDFEQDLPAWEYVKAWVDPVLLPQPLLAKVPDTLAWQHVARVGASLCSLEDARIHRRVQEMAVRTGSKTPGLSQEGRHAQRSILIKTGQWTRALEFRGLPEEATHLLSLCYLASRAGEFDSPRELVSLALRTADWQSMAFCLPVARRSVNGRLVRELDQQIRSTILSSGIAASNAPGAVRTATIFGDVCVPTMCEFWSDAWGQGGKLLNASISSGELAVLDAIEKEHAFAVVAASSPKRITDPKELERARSVMRRLIQRIGDTSGGDAEPDRAPDLVRARYQLRRFLIQRDPDWCVPIGYLLARLHENGKPHRALLKRISTYASSGSLFGIGESSPTFSSTLALVRYADEAGDLRGLLREAEGIEWKDREGARDLVFIANCFDQYKARATDHINRGDAVGLSALQ